MSSLNNHFQIKVYHFNIKFISTVDEPRVEAASRQAPHTCELYGEFAEGCWNSGLWERVAKPIQT